MSAKSSSYNSDTESIELNSPTKKKTKISKFVNAVAKATSGESLFFAKKSKPPNHNNESVTLEDSTPTSSNSQKSKRTYSTKEAKFMQNPKERLIHVKRRVDTLVRGVNQLKTLMGDGGEAYLRVKYKSIQKTLNWEAGKKIIEECNHPNNMDILTAVKSAVTESIKPIAEAVKPIQSSPKAMNKQSSVFSPPKRKTKAFASAVGEQVCGICLKTKVTDGTMYYESGWIGCTYVSSKVTSSTNKKIIKPASNCVFWAHTDCVGFPGLIDDVHVQKMPDYYCALHKRVGRAINKVKTTYVQQKDADYNSDMSDENNEQGNIYPNLEQI